MIRAVVVTDQKPRDVDSIRSRIRNPLRPLRVHVSKFVSSKDFLEWTSCAPEIVLVDPTGMNGQLDKVQEWAGQMGRPAILESLARRGGIRLPNLEDWMAKNSRSNVVPIKAAPNGPAIAEAAKAAADAAPVIPSAEPKDPNAVAPEAVIEVAGVNHSRAVEPFEGEVREVEPGVKLARLTGQTEVRAVDTDYAERLGYAEPRKIRPLIERHLPALAECGEIVKRRMVGRLGNRGNLPPVESDAYLLSKEQMAYLAAKSETANAVRLTVAMVKVATAWEEGRLPGAAPPRRASLVDQARLMLQVAETQEQQGAKIAQLESELAEASQKGLAERKKLQAAIPEAVAPVAAEVAGVKGDVEKLREEVASTDKRTEETVKRAVDAITEGYTEKKKPSKKPSLEGQINMVLPQTIRDMPDASATIKRKLEDAAADISSRIMRDYPNADSGCVNGYARSRLHKHMRQHASCALRIPLGGAIIDMPPAAFQALLDALGAKAVIERVFADTVAYPPERIPPSYR